MTIVDRLAGASRIGLGLAAVGRPGYINLGRDADLPADRPVETMRIRAHELLDQADEFFTARRVHGGERVDRGFSILVVLAGSGRLGNLPVRRVDTLLIPYAAGELTLDGQVEAVCLAASPR